MKERKQPVRKASEDPVKEAMGHPDGPGLEEMINGQEEKKLPPPDDSNQSTEAENSPIPVI